MEGCNGRLHSVVLGPRTRPAEKEEVRGTPLKTNKVIKVEIIILVD